MNFRGWVLLLASVLAAAGTARLGWWQLDRAAQKVALQQARDDRGRLAPLTGDALARDPDRSAEQWHRRAVVEGVWLPDRTVYLDNRPMAGRTGFFVVTPLQLDDGRAVLVQRGWLPRDATDRTRIAPHRTDGGRVRVEGHIAPSPSRLYELGEAASGPIRQNLDVAIYASEARLALLPLVIVQDAVGTTQADGLVRLWPQPASDVHKHYGYAFQWFAISALVLFLYVWFQLIRPRQRAER
jgi:surfeit locus 1 family protein